jgi:hypothetical protein
MSWSPISGTIPQYQKSDGTLASDYYIKFYQSGTTTSFSMATSSTGGTTLDKCQLDSSGYPTTDGTTRFIPHVDQKYKIILYKNSTDADANTTANADWEINGLEQTQTSGSDAWVLFSGTPTYVSATSFTLTGDQTSTFTIGTRLKFTDSTTLHGIVTASVYTSLTTVTVTLNSGSLSGSLTTVYHGISTTVGQEVSTATISHLNTDIATSVIYELEALLNSYPVSALLLGGAVGGDIYAAIALALSSASVAHLIIPAGSFTLSACPVINKAIRIDGAGSCSGNESNATGQPGTSTTQITCTGTNINGIEILGDGTEGVENVHLSNFSLWGSATMNDGIQLGTGVLVTKSSLKNVHVRGFTKTGKLGIRLNRVLEFYMENVYSQFNYHGIGNLNGDICTTLRTMNVHSRTNTVNGVIIQGTFSGGASTALLCEGNGEEGIVIAPGASDSCTGNVFYGYYSEANNAPGAGAATGLAPIVIGNSAGVASDITFYNAKIDDDATNDFGGKSILLDRAEKVCFEDCELTTYNAGFMSATANTSSCQFRTPVASIVETDVTGNAVFFGNPAVRIIDGVPNIKVGTITRDISAADGAVNETGLGFLPKNIQFFAAVDNTSMMSMGMSDGTSQLSVHDTHGVTVDTYGIVTGSIILRSGGSVYTVGTITIDTIGQFTVTWAKTGAPTGTAKIHYTAVG